MANMFGRRDNDGKISILHTETGEAVTRLTGTRLYIRGELGAAYGNPSGLIANSESEAREAVERSGNTWTGME